MNAYEKIRAALEQAYKERHEPRRVDLRIYEALAALAELEKAEAVYLVATGETYEGAETYTRHDVAPALCDCEKLYTAPALPSYDPLGFSYEWEYCGNWFPDFSRTRPIDSPHRRNITPLYTTPPPAKPAPGMFTAEEIGQAWVEGRSLLTTTLWKDSATFKLIQERTK